jgi:hypothetical protein
VISSYRIHQEQIKKVEESLRAPYRRTRTGQGVYEIPGWATVQEKQPLARGSIQLRQQSMLRGKRSQKPESPNLPPPPVPAMRCVRCNSRIHEMDYLYTKKTGLCIPCWEEQEA